MINLYSNFVGELAIIFTERDLTNQILFKVDLWYADFSSLKGFIPLRDNMNTDSLIYNWQKGIGFYDEDLWELKRVQEFHDQLTDITNIPIQAELNNVRNALLQVCQSALQGGNKVFIQYT